LKILVTGGAGYLGTIVSEVFLNSGFSVTILDNLLYKQSSIAHLIPHPNLTFEYGDVRDSHLLKKLLNVNDVIIPLAAIVGAPACDKNPQEATSINKVSVKNMLRMLSRDQIVIMPTTNSAYGRGDSEHYCDERSPLNPISLYAKDKVDVEKELMELPNATSFRLATAFGVSPRMRLDLLLNNFVYRALTDRFLVIFEGHFRRNFIHVRDVAQAFLLALDNFGLFRGEIFNVGMSSANISKIELCRLISEKIPSFVYFEAELAKDPDQRDYLVLNDKIESLGFRAKYSLEYGIDELKKAIPLFSQQLFTNL